MEDAKGFDNPKDAAPWRLEFPENRNFS